MLVVRCRQCPVLTQRGSESSRLLQEIASAASVHVRLAPLGEGNRERGQPQHPPIAPVRHRFSAYPLQPATGTGRLRSTNREGSPPSAQSEPLSFAARPDDSPILFV